MENINPSNLVKTNQTWNNLDLLLLIIGLIFHSYLKHTFHISPNIIIIIIHFKRDLKWVTGFMFLKWFFSYQYFIAKWGGGEWLFILQHGD